MLGRIRRYKPDPVAEEIRRRFQEDFGDLIPAEPTTPEPVMPQAAPGCEVDDFLPPDLRVPSHDQVDGRMMPWPQPLILNGEMVCCAGCGAYRGWIVISTRDEIWLRCRTGHQQRETRLDTAWYNRTAGPVDATHATFEDCLRHLGH
ncbi:hypothetical protein [Streptomyces murinus]|uniref:hypothetical protein n=1 Tax=Streptomyces murinus TaxID=33900 RepID=UPI0036E93F41